MEPSGDQLDKEENARLIHSLDEKIKETDRKLKENEQLEKEFLPIWNTASNPHKRIGKPTAIIIKSKEEAVKNKNMLVAKLSKIKTSILHHHKQEPPVENRFRTVIEGHGIIINPMFEILEREERQRSGEGTSRAVAEAPDHEGPSESEEDEKVEEGELLTIFANYC